MPLLSVSGSYTVTIHGTNDLPDVAAATAQVTEDTALTASGTLPAPHDTDIHDTLSFLPQNATEGAYGSLTLAADGHYTYTLHNDAADVQNLHTGQSLTDTFTYTVTDNHGGTGSNTLTVTIHGLDEPSGGGTYAAPQTASLSVTAETGEAVPAGTGATSTLPDYLQPEGDSLASVLNHYASSRFRARARNRGYGRYAPRRRRSPRRFAPALVRRRLERRQYPPPQKPRCMTPSRNNTANLTRPPWKAPRKRSSRM